MNVKHFVKLTRKATRLGMTHDRLCELLCLRGIDTDVAYVLATEAAHVKSDTTLTVHLLRHGFVHVPHSGDPQERRDIIDIGTGETVWSKVDHASLVWPWLAEVAVQRQIDKAPR